MSPLAVYMRTWLISRASQPDCHRPARLVLLARLFGDDDAAFGIVVAVAVIVRHADEIEHREGGLVARLARAAAAHLLVQDGRAREAREDEVDHLGAVEAGVEHVDRHQDLREALLLEAADLAHAVDRIVGALAADHVVGEAHVG